MSKRILVVEDQPDNRQIIRDLLAGIDKSLTFLNMACNKCDKVAYGLQSRRCQSENARARLTGS